MFLLLLCITPLTACSHSDSDSNTISESDLSQREDAILATTSNQAFVFDFDMDSAYKEASVWIEKYEAGKLVNDKLNQLTTQIEDKGSIIFTASNKRNKENLQMFNTGISTNGSTASTSFIDQDSPDLEDMSGLWGTSLSEDKTLPEGEIVLANISYSDEDSISSLSINFYDKPEKLLDELEKHDVSYLLKAEFKK